MAFKKVPDHRTGINVLTGYPHDHFWQILFAAGPSVATVFNGVEHHFGILAALLIHLPTDPGFVAGINIRQILGYGVAATVVAGPKSHGAIGG